MRNLSFRDLATVAIGAYVAGNGRDSSLAPRVQFWIDQFGDRDVTTLTHDDIEDGVDVLVKRCKVKVLTTRAGVTRTVTDKRISGATVNRYVASLGTCFKLLGSRGVQGIDGLRLLPRGFVPPMRGVTRHREGDGRTLTVTVDDVKRLVAACRVSRNRKLAALVAMACTTGWRQGSLNTLTWGALDLKSGLADTPRTKNGTPHRTPLEPWVVEELRRMKPDTAGPNDPVFGRRAPLPGKPDNIVRPNVDKAWTTALERAGLPTEWTLHHCRHIAASVLSQSGASVATVMQALNHKTVVMAMRYSHLNVDSLRESLSRAWA